MSLRFTTTGESHGPGLVAVVEGLPAGLELAPEDIDRDLARRQLGHGRGGRMQIDSVRARGREVSSPADFEGVDESPVRCLDDEAGAAMVAEIDAARKANESLGGVFEVRAFGLVPGVGSHVRWDERLDARIAQAMMSIHAMKGVAIGDGFDLAGRVGSQAHDEIF